jgi:Uma2 family endonuclease
MHAIAHNEAQEPVGEQRVLLSGVSWADYLRLLDIRGDRPVPRMAFLDGTLELMSPSRFHERIATMLGRLLEQYALERDVPLYGFGSWTLRREEGLRGVEPDECYVVGRPEAEVPDIVIEVEHTSGGLDKLPIYAALGVPEVWRFARGTLTLHALRDDHYAQVPRSALLPDLDPAVLADFAARTDQHAAIKAWRDLLRA